MTFTQAVSSVLGQYAGFRGRARRSEFWWWNLFTLLVGVAVAAAELSLGMVGDNGGPVSTLLGLALLLPNVTVCVRRLHDISRSGWWLLIAVLPFVGLVVLFVFFVTPSTAGGNAHGPDPRQQDQHPSAVASDRPGPDDDAPPVAGQATTGGQESAAGWTPPGWDLPSAVEPGAGRPAQDRGRADDGPTDPDRPTA